MVRSLKRPESTSIDPYKAQPLPLGKPVSVYYRQSSEGQIGNISTTLQTVDMVEHLMKQGWHREQINMIDMDAGISGMKKIAERPGMSLLYQQIENGEIGLVAAQDVDRFFRDITQIETNIFIDACRRNNVQVLTPSFVYDFAHPTQGRYHMQMFRDQAQRAADYIEHQIRGRLVKARQWRQERGLWTGRKILSGFMVDMRKTLPDGSPNPDWRKYKRFDPYADVILRYFEIFREFDGNFSKTWRHIEENGPYLPDISPDMIPEGFKATDHLSRRSKHTGGLTPSASSLQYMLINVAYIGHWIHQQIITVWHNHEPIIPNDLFMFAFNRISPTDFHGNRNENYVPYRPWTRHAKADRPEEPPIYSGLVFSDDLPDQPHHTVASVWGTHANKYQYQLFNYSEQRANIWNIKAYIVDNIVDKLLLKRLQATVIDEDTWKEALSSYKDEGYIEIRRLRTAIKQAEQAKDNIINTLATMTHPEMVERAEIRYTMLERELESKRARLMKLESDRERCINLEQARYIFEFVIVNWQQLPRQERRALFEIFAKYIKIKRIARHTKHIYVHWRDGSISEERFVHKSLGDFWQQEDLERLKAMFESNIAQEEILKTFPNHTWRALKERIRYHFGKNLAKSYSGKRSHSHSIKWNDIVANRITGTANIVNDQQTQVEASCILTYRLG